MTVNPVWEHKFNRHYLYVFAFGDTFVASVRKHKKKETYHAQVFETTKYGDRTGRSIGRGFDNLDDAKRWAEVTYTFMRAS